MKICKKHNIEYLKKCSICVKEYNKIYKEIHKYEIKIQRRQYRIDNKEILNKEAIKYYCDNKENLAEKTKIYRKNNIEKINEYNRNYFAKNKETILKNRRNIKVDKAKRNKKLKEKRETNIFFKLKLLISTKINRALKLNGSSKNGQSILKYLSYTIQELKEHLEKQFEPWMNWENRGAYLKKEWKDNDPTTWKWNIDHIIPQSDLKYTSMEDKNFKKVWALSNLRPYSAKQNIIDGAQKVRHQKKS